MIFVSFEDEHRMKRNSSYAVPCTALRNGFIYCPSGHRGCSRNADGHYIIEPKKGDKAHLPVKISQ